MLYTMYLFVEQEALFKEFSDFCYPSVYMNERSFAKYMLSKGLKEEKMEDTFRYFIRSVKGKIDFGVNPQQV